MPLDALGDIYFSADVESDGPIPGSFSMLSFALVAVATFDGEHFERLDPREAARYWELQPITDRFDPQRWRSTASIASGCSGRARPPRRRCGRLIGGCAAWPTVVGLCSSPTPPPSTGRYALVLLVVRWCIAFRPRYMHRHPQPLHRRRRLDLRAVLQEPYADRAAPILPAYPQCLGDAVEQGELFGNLFEWALLHSPSTVAADLAQGGHRPGL